jgi:small nuclear ribonucleoprotein
MQAHRGEGGPLEMMKLVINSPVSVRLRDGEEIKGILKGFDQHLNILLTQAQRPEARDDILFIRGDLVMLLSPEPV